MTLTFLQNPAGLTPSTISKPIDSLNIGFSGTNGSNYSVTNVTVIIHYTDNTTSIRENIMGSSYKIEVVPGKQISSVDVINLSTDSFLVNGVTTGVISSVIEPDDVNLNFSIDIIDTDGDIGSNSFGIGIDAKGTLTGTSNNDAILGTSENDIISGGAGDDNIDGGNDIINGGACNDTIVYDSNDSVIDGGVGNDTLILSGSDSIDFSSIPDNTIQSIENIDMTALGSQSVLNLTLADVMDMVPDASGISGTNVSSTDHVLRITGDNTDNVSLDSIIGAGVWSKGTTETIDSVTYDVYTNNTESSYKVLIQTDIIDTTV